MKFSELIDSCVECLKGFNPIIKTIDSHADDFLKDVSLAINKIAYSTRTPMRRFSSNRYSMVVSAIRSSLRSSTQSSSNVSRPPRTGMTMCCIRYSGISLSSAWRSWHWKITGAWYCLRIPSRWIHSFSLCSMEKHSGNMSGLNGWTSMTTPISMRRSLD